jgi:hypothetical protein
MRTRARLVPARDFMRHGETTLLSLRSRGTRDTAVALACMASAIAVSLLQSFGYLDGSIALWLVVGLAAGAGFATENRLRSVLEVRVERDGVLLREIWGSRRYIWRDIADGFQVIGGASGPRIAFTWRSGSATGRAFLHPGEFGLSAANLAALLNDQWDSA